MSLARRFATGRCCVVQALTLRFVVRKAVPAPLSGGPPGGAVSLPQPRSGSRHGGNANRLGVTPSLFHCTSRNRNARPLRRVVVAATVEADRAAPVTFHPLPWQ